MKLVVLTHGDLDHSGNCARLKSTYKVPIAVHLLDSSAVESGLSPRRALCTPLGKFFSERIGLFHRRRIGLQTFTPDVLLEDGQSLDAYGLAAKVLHFPGHTKGSIAVLTEGGLFFAGDLYTNRRKPGLSLFIEDFGEYRASIEKAKHVMGSIRTV